MGNMDAAALLDLLEDFYATMAERPAELGKLYREGSRLKFEGEKIRGKEEIVAQLTSHPFARCKHSITTVDYNASDNDGGLLVFVNGVLDVQQDGEGHALNFSQLMPTPEGEFYILSDMFRVATPAQSQVSEGVLAHVATAMHA